MAVIGWGTHQPLIFASLGPTAYELIETPNRPSARPYNIIVGNLVAILAAYAALALTRGWFAPSVSSHGVPPLRISAVVVAVVLTVFGTLLLRATQPAALATTLLIATGLMQTFRDGLIIIIAVILITIAGEPVRRIRAKTMPD